MWILFCLYCLILILISYRIHKTWINPFTVLSAPYIVVVSLNTAWGEKMGFFKIENNGLGVIAFGLSCFFIGTMFSAFTVSRKFATVIDSDHSDQIENYNLRSMLIYSMIVSSFGIAKVASIILRQGFLELTREGALVSGIFGHLLLSSYPLQPILLLHWIRNKKQKAYGMSVLMTAGLLFMSFVKYHVLSYIVVCFLFLVLTVKKYLRKGTVFLVVLTVGLFIINYILGFLASNVLSSVSNEYYMQHFWKYLVGAVVNGSTYLSGRMGGDASVAYKMMSFLFAFPNMFIQFLTSKRVFDYIGCQYSLVSYIGEGSNVVDAITYMYPVRGEVFEVIQFAFYHLIFGALLESIFILDVFRTTRLHISAAVIFTFFLFFSFFGTFYINSAPWEICVYSIFFVELFNKKARIKLKLKM